MTVYQISAAQRPVMIVAPDDGPSLIINRDPFTQLLIGNDVNIGIAEANNVTIVDPLGTIAVNGNLPVFGVSIGGVIEVHVQRDASQWSLANNEIIEQLGSTTNSFFIAPGNNFHTELFDVRSFSSYYFQANLVGVFPTAFNPIRVKFEWWADAGASFRIYVEDITFWADGFGGMVSDVSYGQILLEDVMHGPFFSYSITNLASVDTVQIVTSAVFASTRTLPGPYFRQAGSSISNEDGGLYDADFTIVAGGLYIPLPFAYGDTETTLYNNGAAAMSLNLSWAPFQTIPVGGHLLANIPAGGVTPTRKMSPKRSGLILITGTAGQGGHLVVNSLFNKI